MYKKSRHLRKITTCRKTSRIWGVDPPIILMETRMGMCIVYVRQYMWKMLKCSNDVSECFRIIWFSPLQWPHMAPYGEAYPHSNNLLLPVVASSVWSIPGAETNKRSVNSAFYPKSGGTNCGNILQKSSKISITGPALTSSPSKNHQKSKWYQILGATTVEPRSAAVPWWTANGRSGRHRRRASHRVLHERCEEVKACDIQVLSHLKKHVFLSIGSHN